MTTEMGQTTPPETKETDNQTPENQAETTTAGDPLQPKIDELQKQLEATQKGLRTAHATLTEKDRLLKEQADLRAELADNKETMKLLMGYIAEKDSGDSELSQERKESLLQRYERETKTREEARKKKEAENQQTELTAKVGGYQKRVEALGLDSESDAYLDIKELVVDAYMTGNPVKWEKVERKLSNMEKEKKKPEVKDLEAERAKIREEEKKKILIERGELDTETGMPSGARNDEAVRKRYRENPNDPKAYQDYKAYLNRTRGIKT